MAGELWQSEWQIGLEITAGTGVAATRRMYYDTDASNLKRERAANRYKFATGTRDNTRIGTLGPIEVSGSVKMPLSASEIIEPLLMGLKAGVTAVGVGPDYLWTFVPGETLAPATLEWQNGAEAFEANGVYVNKISLDGSVDGANDMTFELFGMSLETTTMTGALAARTPDVIEGWETKLYIDNLGATPGTTEITGTLINWKVEIDNQLNRKYFAGNTLEAGAIPMGEIMVSASLTFEAAAAQSATEFTNWDAETERLIRLEFGQNEIIGGSDKKFVKVDIPGAWNKFDLAGSDKGTRTYELGIDYIYDATNAFGVQIIAQNARATAW